IAIRQNWFPRWKATVNGESVPVARAGDGTMIVTAPSGRVDLTLVYVVTAWDWVARIAAGIGVLMTIGLAAGMWPRLWRRLARGG
ncbi:unnamed protein product, partial [Phaeothamnion confervicola]